MNEEKKNVIEEILLILQKHISNDPNSREAIGLQKAYEIIEAQLS